MHACPDLEFQVLMLLRRKETHGYDIKRGLETIGVRIAAGSVYRILNRLKDRGLVTTRDGKPEAGGVRVLCELTDAGWEACTEAISVWGKVIERTQKTLHNESDGSRGRVRHNG